MQFGPEVCGSLEAASEHEWLETNGLGGFASSTICGLNTRRYHALLTAATNPPVGRVVLLSKLEETVVINGQRYELGVNQYPGAIHPDGHRFLTEFRLDPFPTFVYRVAGVTITKRVFMVQGENTTVIEYEMDADIDLELRPLIAFRDYHGLMHENDALQRPAFEIVDAACIRIAPYGDAFYLSHQAEAVEATGYWYRDFEYTAEKARGLDHREDLFQPCALYFRGVKQARIVASTERHPRTPAARIETNRDDSLMASLFRATDAFLVARGDSKTIIAGYHWFSDWGRDTMIALPGLTLSTRRPEIARGILETFANAANQGMLPNRFPDNPNDALEYNTVDATLWMFEAVRLYLAHTGDREFVITRMLPRLEEIVDWHVRGTRYGIRVDPLDGLLQCGEEGVQLTWMDAKVGDWVVTPRRGKPVEIQALWYNALCTMQEVSPAARYRELAQRCRMSFLQRFWNADTDCLYDCVDGETADASIRPNQILALSLGYTMLPVEESLSILKVVERELLTPMGLRTLSAKDPQYRGRYGGGVVERDGAYHQGTVWPWLLGSFLRAYLRIHGRSPQAVKQARQWLDPFRAHLKTAGLGSISEIADGDAPHHPGGCIAQAWSVAELLRAALEIHQT